MPDEHAGAERLATSTAELLRRLPARAAPVRAAVFAALRRGETLTPQDVAARTGLSVDDVGARLAALEAIGIAQRDQAGRVFAADGLSTIPTRHRLVLDGVPLHTWCAIDAIGIPAALGVDATATTACPTCGAQLEIRYRRGEPDAPTSLVAWLPVKACSNIVEEFCPEANLFCNDQHLGAWRADHDQPAGHTLSVPQAIEQSRRVWAQLAANFGPNPSLNTADGESTNPGSATTNTRRAAT